MKNSNRIWRSLLFVLLIAALCGAMAVPILAPVSAAPKMQAATDLVISEFRFRGSAMGNDEFIEIYNPTSSIVDLNGWKIQRSNTAGTVNDQHFFTTTILLNPGQHYLIANPSYDDTVTPPDATYSTGGTGIVDGGGIALIRADNSIADQVGMTNCVGCFFENSPLTSLGTSNLDRSYERIFDISGVCTDSNNNAADFFLRNPSDPQNLSSAVTTCGNPTPIPTATSTDTPTATATATSTPTATATATGTATNTSPPPATGIVISEFRTIGTSGGNDEFIELYNPTGSSISIANWMINKSSGCGTTITTIATIPSTVTLAAGKHYLIGGTSYSGSVTADLSSSLNIADNGGIALLQSDGVTIVDQVGLCSTTQYREGTALTPLTTNVNRGYDRKSTALGSCVDSNNNAADFILRTPSDPQNSSSPLTVCGNPTPTPTATPPRTATPRPSPTRTPTPLPPPELVAINEFVPRPGHDWNNDGLFNTSDEFIEIINHGTISVDLDGYSLDDEVNLGSDPYSLPSVTLDPGERIVFYGSETGLLLSDGGDGVRLLAPNGGLVDAFNYTVVNYPDQSYCRLPDNGGLDDWNRNCFPTPGCGIR